MEDFNRTTFNILFYIKSDKEDKDGLVPIYMRLTIDGKKAEYSVARKIDPDRWNHHGYVKGNKEDAKKINSYLDILRSKIYDYQRDMIHNNELVTATAIVNRLKGRSQVKKTILETFRVHNQLLRERTGIDFAPATLKRYDTTLKHIEEYISYQYGVNDLYLSQMDYSFITNLEHYFKTIRGCNHNTTMKYIKNFKKVVLMAVAKNWLTRDPFMEFKTKIKDVKRTYLTEEELEIIENKKIAIKHLERVRDIFVFCCYTGLSWVDVANLTYDKIVIGINKRKWISNERLKTGIHYDIPLFKKALEIMDKYADHPERQDTNLIFPVASNQKINVYLKELATICGISKNLTFHAARHTFATIALSNDMPIETVSSLLGHKSLRTTQIYAKIVKKKVATDMEALEKKLEARTMNNKQEINVS